MHNISAHEARARFGELLDAAGREPVIIERDGEPVAVLLSKAGYDELYELKQAGLRAAIAVGLTDLERGAAAALDAPALRQLGERIKAAGRAALNGP